MMAATQNDFGHRYSGSGLGGRDFGRYGGDGGGNSDCVVGLCDGCIGHRDYGNDGGSGNFSRHRSDSGGDSDGVSPVMVASDSVTTVTAAAAASDAATFAPTTSVATAVTAAETNIGTCEFQLPVARRPKELQAIVRQFDL